MGIDELINEREPFAGQTLVEGIIYEEPASATSLLKVVLPAFDAQQAFTSLRWMPRGNDMPPSGAQCLVALTATGGGWVIAWWPS